MNGLVLDIHRCSLHDGPGIRTAVFLKGCPLRCQWCHNPESQSFERELSFFSERCTFCNQCASVCKTGAHTVSIDSKTHLIDRSRCVQCGACVSACLSDALELKGEKKSVDEVMEIVLKDKVYYDASGGGITLSGGEPMAQFDFAYELLSRAVNAGIHTCMETCGYAPAERFRKVMGKVDLFLFDIKGVDDEKHIRNTGVSNKLIFDNLKFLAENGNQIRIRCPLLPSVNDSDADLKLIAELYKKLKPDVTGVEVMPYHHMGAAKGFRVGMTGGFDMPSATENHRERWVDFLKTRGCNIIEG